MSEVNVISPVFIRVVVPESLDVFCVDANTVTPLPERFVGWAIAAGAKVVEAENTPEMVELAESILNPPKNTNFERLVEVCKELIVTNEVRNFTRSGRPRIEAVRDMVDFEVTTEALQDAYDTAVNAVPAEAVLDDPI